MTDHRLATALVCALHILFAGCSPQPDIEAIGRLQSGMDALLEGAYAQALQDCRVAARSLPDNLTANQCVLVAAIHLQNWPVAYEQITAIEKTAPSDWTAALAVQTARYAGIPNQRDISSLADDAAVWACLDGWCPGTAAFATDNRLGLLQRGLLLHATGDPKAAVALLESGPRTSDTFRLLALLYLQLKQADKLKKLLLQGGLQDDSQAQTAVQLALYLRHDAFFATHAGPVPCPATPDAMSLPHSSVSWSADLRALAGAYLTMLNVAAKAAPDPRPPPAASQVSPTVLAFFKGISSPGRNQARGFSALARTLPDSPLAHLNAGTAYLQQGDIKTARMHLERAVTLAPGEALPVSYLYIARLLDEQFDQASALLATSGGGLNDEWLNWLRSLAPDQKPALSTAIGSESVNSQVDSSAVGCLSTNRDREGADRPTSRAQPVQGVRSLTVTVRNKAPNGRGVHPRLMLYSESRKSP